MNFLNAMISRVTMKNLKHMYEMIDRREAVRKSSINGVTYDIPLWLNAGF